VSPRMSRSQMRRAVVNPLKFTPEVRDTMRRAVMQQVFSSMASSVYEWVAKAKGRKFIIEQDGEGVAFWFEENGETVEPDFMTKKSSE